ncbi:uncharacterized protein LOC132680145 [Panthera onca]
MRRWRRQLRNEAPVLQRHSALLQRPPRAGGNCRGEAAAGSIRARSPGAEQAAGPAHSRRAGWGGASGAQSQCAAQRARPAPSFLSPGGEKTSDGFCELAGSLGGGEAL